MGKQKYFDTALKQERAVLVGVIRPGERPEETREYLDELAFLVDIPMIYWLPGGLIKSLF